MAGWARPKKQVVMGSRMRDLTWDDLQLQNLDGIILRDWIPDTLWVKSLGFDAMETGLYILSTQDDDVYFTAHSADLEFRGEIPTDETNGENMKTQTTTRPVGFMRAQETTVIRYPSVKWLDGTELTDAEKGYLATGEWGSSIIASCDHGWNIIEINDKYLAVIAFEDCL